MLISDTVREQLSWIYATFTRWNLHVKVVTTNTTEEFSFSFLYFYVYFQFFFCLKLWKSRHNSWRKYIRALKRHGTHFYPLLFSFIIFSSLNLREREPFASKDILVIPFLFFVITVFSFFFAHWFFRGFYILLILASLLSRLRGIALKN